MPLSQNLTEWLQALRIKDSVSTQDILSGQTLHNVLKAIHANYQNQFLTPASNNKIINWNNLLKQLQTMKITVPPQDKAQILQGSFKTVQNILLQVKNSLKDKKQDSVDLSRIDSKSDPKQTKSLLELFVILLMRNFQLSMKQSIALLSNDSKYLAHVLAKGFKEQLAPVLSLLKDFQTYLPQIQQFCINKENQVFFMKALKPGLISRFREISGLSLQILIDFSSKTSNPFQTMKNHLISTFVLQYRRHPGLISQICTGIVTLSKYNKSLLSVLVSDMSQKEYLAFNLQILSIASQSNQLKQFYGMMKVDELLNLCIESLLDRQNFQLAMLLLVQVIETNQQMVTEDDKKLIRIVSNLQKLVVNKKQSTIAMVNGIFGLFNIFRERNVSVTPFLFNIIIAKFKSTFNEEESAIYSYNLLSLIQESFVLQGNLIVIFVDAIVQKYDLHKEAITALDLEVLLRSVAVLCEGKKQPNPTSITRKNQVYIESSQLLDEQSALRILNAFSQMFFEDTSNSFTITEILVTIVDSFSQSPAIIESIVRIIKISLAIYFANIRKLTISKQSPNGSIKLDQSNVMVKRKNLDIENLLTKMVELENEEISSNAQAFLCYSYVQTKAKSTTQASGLAKIISLLGELPTLLQKYADDVKQVQKSKKNNQNFSPSQTQSQTSSTVQLLNKKKHIPGQNYSQYLTKLSRVGHDAQKGIEKYQKTFQDKKKKALEDQLRKIQEEQKMEQLQKKFSLKVLEKGVRIDPKIDTLSKYLYEFNTKENEIKKEAVYQLSSLHIFNPAQEETNDFEGLKYVLKKYNKVLKVFYTQYGGKLKSNVAGLPEEQPQKQNLLQLSQAWKIFKDFELDEFMTIKEAQYLVQRLNTLKKKTYNDNNLLDFEIFEDFIVQASFTMFTRPPKDLSCYTITGMVEETFYQFKMLAAQNKIDIRLFDDQMSLVEQDESIAALNIELKRNPDYILPQGYKKIVEKKVEYYNSISLNAFDQSFTDVIDVLDEIIYQKLNFHIIEPFSEIVTNVYAKSFLSKKKEQSQDTKQKYFSLNVKKQLFRYSGEDRKIGRQVAFCLSQIVDAVEHGRKSLFPKNKLITYQQQQQDKKRTQEQLQHRRQKRDQQIKRQLMTQKQQRQQKRQQQEEQRIKEMKKTEQEKLKKKQYEQSLKKKIEEYQQKKESQKRKDEEEKMKEKRKEEEQYEKKRKEYLKVAKQIEEKKGQNKRTIERVQNSNPIQDNKAPPKKSKSKSLLRVKTNPEPLNKIKQKSFHKMIEPKLDINQTQGTSKQSKQPTKLNLKKKQATSQQNKSNIVLPKQSMGNEFLGKQNLK